MDDPVVAYYGMVKFLPIMLGKMCQQSLLEWMDDGQIATSQHGWMDGRMGGWMDKWMDFLMDDSVVAFYGMVEFLPIMLGKVSDELVRVSLTTTQPIVMGTGETNHSMI
jgi:hypothetical protein